MDTKQLRLVRDPDRTFLDVPQGGGDPILHMREDEPITVAAQDHQGAFSSPWFPFLAGAVVGNVLGGGGFGGGRGGGQTIIINNPAPGERSYDANTPTYRYPPTGTFGRDDSLHGSVDTSKPQAPDYSKVQPSPYATSGNASGTGGGVAASNKAPGGVTGAAQREFWPIRRNPAAALPPRARVALPMEARVSRTPAARALLAPAHGVCWAVQARVAARAQNQARASAAAAKDWVARAHLPLGRRSNSIHVQPPEARPAASPGPQ